MVLCIIPPNFRPIAAILIEFEWKCHAGWAGRQTVSRMDGNLTLTGSDNGLAPGWRQAIICTQCWNIVNWTLRNKHQWNFHQNSHIFIQENVFENIVSASMCSITTYLHQYNLHWCNHLCIQPTPHEWHHLKGDGISLSKIKKMSKPWSRHCHPRQHIRWWINIMGFIMVHGLNDGHVTPCKMILQSYMHIDGLV